MLIKMIVLHCERRPTSKNVTLSWPIFADLDDFVPECGILQSVLFDDEVIINISLQGGINSLRGWSTHIELQVNLGYVHEIHHGKYELKW